MNSDQFEELMRAGERYHQARIPDDHWIVLRMDGRSFTAFTSACDKPFDQGFHDAMAQVAQVLLDNLGGLYAHTQSDEVSIYLPASTQLFSREAEKLASVGAGLATSAFQRHYAAGALAYPHFDGRVWVGQTIEEVVDYARWRRADAERGCINSHCYWLLRNHGESERQATRALHGQNQAQRLAFLQSEGITYATLPAWQRLGTGVAWKTVETTGYNPLTQQTTQVSRRHIVRADLPDDANAYGAMVRAALTPPVKEAA